MFNPVLFFFYPSGRTLGLVWCSIWPKEANTAILCEGEVDTERNFSISRSAEYDTERQSLASCAVLNTTEMKTQMEFCEEMMRGIPRCSKQEWRQKKRLKSKTVGGLLYGFRLLSCGFMAGRWAFAPIPSQIHPRETTDSFSVSTITRRLFLFVCCCPCFFLHTFWAISVRVCMIRL